VTIVVDTSVLIDHLRGNALARVALANAVGDRQRLTSSV
jgi:predicted nucleic acid-binding protein